MLIRKTTKLTDTHKVGNVLLFFPCKSKEPLKENDYLCEVRECQEKGRGVLGRPSLRTASLCSLAITKDSSVCLCANLPVCCLFEAGMQGPKLFSRCLCVIPPAMLHIFQSTRAEEKRHVLPLSLEKKKKKTDGDNQKPARVLHLSPRPPSPTPPIPSFASFVMAILIMLLG